jgi:hypothetical protein
MWRICVVSSEVSCMGDGRGFLILWRTASENHRKCAFFKLSLGQALERVQ